GGEFGLALVAIALDAMVLDQRLGQIAITSVLLSMIAGAFLIRFNSKISNSLVKTPEPQAQSESPKLAEGPERQVVIGGYGRVGHTVAVLLHSNGVPFVA